MKWMNKLERHAPWLALPNLSLMIVASQAAAYVGSLYNPQVALSLALDPVAVVAGSQWHRLLTYILLPGMGAGHPLLAFFWFWFLWTMCRSLELEWGNFRATLYVIIGTLAGAAVPMLSYLIFDRPLFSTGFYWTLSLNLAFARLFPEFTLYFFFVLPVKMRWWAWVIGAYLLYQCYLGGLSEAAVIAGSLANYLIFFGPGFVNSAKQRRANAALRDRVAQVARQVEAVIVNRRCKQCQQDASLADLRLCTCDACGEDGQFWCMEHVKEHLAGQPKRKN